MSNHTPIEFQVVTDILTFESVIKLPNPCLNHNNSQNHSNFTALN